MRINEFLIKRYGPLRDKSYILSHNFSLFFGRNEDGKTLTIDALVRLLLGRNIRDFELIDRVEENPEGYVIVKNDRGKEVKLPEKGTLAKVADLTLSACRNILVIRNSDLAIPRENEFYMDLTDRLIGLRTAEISGIKEALREIGKATPSGSLRDIKDEKLKTRVEHARDLLGRIVSLAGEVKEEKYDELEEQAARYSDRLDRIEEMIEELEDARKRERYEKGRKACDSLRESLRKLEDMEIYNTENGQLWRDCHRDIQRFWDDKEALEREVEREKAELKILGEAFYAKERDFRVVKETRDKIDNEIRQKLIHYEERCQQFVLMKKKNSVLTVSGLISTMLLGICLLGIIIRPSLPLFLILAVVFLILAIVLWMLKLQIVRYKASLARDFESIRLALSRFELGGESIEEILSNIQRFDVGYRRKNEEFQHTERKKENLEGRIRELEDKRIPEIDKKIKEAEGRIDETKTDSKAGSLEEYMEGLLLKQKLEKSRDEYASVLRSHFGESHEKSEQNISDWEKKVGTLEKYREKAKGTKYSENAMSELEKEKQQIEEDLRKANSKIGSFQKKMAEIERKVNEVLRPGEEHLYCKTSVDLEGVRNRLQVFLDENERNRDNALKAMSIFEEIEREEKERVSQLFEAESPVSKYFGEITGGLYEEVTLDPSMGQIEARREDGVVLGAEKLSGGAYDQLYLSIRLALGERLLRGKKGFFIMDDPFIKADADRLQRQVEVLRAVSASGWQIMYFSAKEEIRKAFEKDIETGVIDYFETQSIFS